MDQPETSGEPVIDAFMATIRECADATRAAERVAAAVTALRTPLQYLNEAFEADPELAPELATAVSQIEEAAAALNRSGEFIIARFDVKLQQILHDLTEGGTSA